MSSKKKSISQKSTISIVIISVITGGIIALQDHFNKDYQANTYRIYNQPPLAPVKTIRLTEPEVIAASSSIAKDVIAEPLKGKESILFVVASAEIKPAYFAALSATAERIKMAAKDKQTVWQIVGHADHSGTLQFNLKLAKQRAQAVADFLLDKGVEQALISVLSLGESSPVTFSQSGTSNGLDRRVEIHHYQAEIAALAKRLDGQIKPSDEHHQKVKPLQESIAVIAATDFSLNQNWALNQNQALTLRSEGIRF
jgi:outer membrane protein OmpA-like peptidoglycan-associated protein